MKIFTGTELPQMAAAPGNPSGKHAADDVQFNGVTVVQKDQFYNPVYLAALDEGCAETEPKGKQKPVENKGGAEVNQ